MKTPTRFAFALILLAACSRQEKVEPAGNAKHGLQLIDQYGCNACHSIPGISGPKGTLGPPLDHIGSRTLIARKFPNTPGTLAKWLQNPQAMDPQNTMPNLGITAADTRDIAAYLDSLK